jgi:hypothetical protein
LTISVGRRPYRSASRPNTAAPTALHASVKVMAKATLPIGALNVAATSRSTNAMMKKSNASNVHPK